MCCDIPVGRRLFLYNTVCEIILHDYTGDAGAVLDACEMTARHVQDMLNAYDPESELGRMNRLHRPGVPYAVSAELYTLLRRMDRFSARCQGAYDATVRPLVELWDFTAPQPAIPSRRAIRAAMERCGYSRVRYDDGTQTLTFSEPGMSIDAGGVGKGYAAGCVAECLHHAGILSASINFGGELYLLGAYPSAEGSGLWPVAVQKPGAARGVKAGRILLAQDLAVASSGSYDRFFRIDGETYCHILDPRTGWPVPAGMESVTVVCGDPVLAELLSTAIFVLGREDGAALALAHGAQCLFADSNGEICITELPQPLFRTAN